VAVVHTIQDVHLRVLRDCGPTSASRGQPASSVELRHAPRVWSTLAIPRVHTNDESLMFTMHRARTGSTEATAAETTANVNGDVNGGGGGDMGDGDDDRSDDDGGGGGGGQSGGGGGGPSSSGGGGGIVVSGDEGAEIDGGDGDSGGDSGDDVGTSTKQHGGSDNKEGSTASSNEHTEPPSSLQLLDAEHTEPPSSPQLLDAARGVATEIEAAVNSIRSDPPHGQCLRPLLASHGMSTVFLRRWMWPLGRNQCAEVRRLDVACLLSTDCVCVCVCVCTHACAQGFVTRCFIDRRLLGCAALRCGLKRCAFAPCLDTGRLPHSCSHAEAKPTVGSVGVRAQLDARHGRCWRARGRQGGACQRRCKVWSSHRSITSFSHVISFLLPVCIICEPPPNLEEHTPNLQHTIASA
jgi:hypothetical protein